MNSRRSFLAVTLLIGILPGCDEDRGSSKPSGNLRSHSREKASESRAINAAPANFEAGLSSLKTKNTAKIDNINLKEKIDFLKNAPLDQCKEYLLTLPVGPESDALLRDFSIRYATENLTEALEWLKTIPQEAANRSAFSQIGRLSVNNPAAALEAAASIQDPGLKAKFGTGFMIGLSNLDQATIEHYLADSETLGLLGIRSEEAIVEILRGKGKEETLQEATGILENYLRSNRAIVPGSASEQIRTLTKLNNMSVRNIIESLPEDRTKVSDIVAPFVEEWASQDPIEAASWLSNQSGEKKDRGSIGLIRAIASSEPLASAQIGLSLSSSSLRYQALSELKNRSRYERDAILSAIDKSGLPAEEIKSIRSLYSK